MMAECIILRYVRISYVDNFKLFDVIINSRKNVHFRNIRASYKTMNDSMNELHDLSVCGYFNIIVTHVQSFLSIVKDSQPVPSPSRCHF